METNSQQHPATTGDADRMQWLILVGTGLLVAAITALGLLGGP